MEWASTATVGLASTATIGKSVASPSNSDSGMWRLLQLCHLRLMTPEVLDEISIGDWCSSTLGTQR
ncbi:hypothetical protein DY000_02043481 [Brassica cretica]|uniref:Uncharacterized protein n=1 Tax=Brassica cretica TaxID=69181 RepID=A0ABQ7BLX0_BRACR|nr:hypothetical protein DY000_02043481 [Brassica cretica]